MVVYDRRLLAIKYALKHVEDRYKEKEITKDEMERLKRQILESDLRPLLDEVSLSEASEALEIPQEELRKILGLEDIRERVKEVSEEVVEVEFPIRLVGFFALILILGSVFIQASRAIVVQYLYPALYMLIAIIVMTLNLDRKIVKKISLPKFFFLLALILLILEFSAK